MNELKEIFKQFESITMSYKGENTDWGQKSKELNALLEKNPKCKNKIQSELLILRLDCEKVINRNIMRKKKDSSRSLLSMKTTNVSRETYSVKKNGGNNNVNKH